MSEFTEENIPERDRADLGDYPEDVRKPLAAICELWALKPPKHKKDKGYWIEGGRRIRDACGEFDTVGILRSVFVDYNKLLHKGQAYTVEGPGSLVKVCRAMAAKQRIHAKFWD